MMAREPTPPRTIGDALVGGHKPSWVMCIMREQAAWLRAWAAAERELRVLQGGKAG